MASFLGGYGSPCMMADNGSGKVRVTFPSTHVDWEFYSEVAVDGSHYLYNGTTATSAAITAKGCVDGAATTWPEKDLAGFYFDLGGVDFPDGDWNNDDLVSITLQAAANHYSTIQLARAAMSLDDTLLPEFSDTEQARYHYYAGVGGGNKAVSIIGRIGRQQIVLVNNGVKDIARFTGDLSAQVNQVTVRNFTALLDWTGSLVHYAPDSGKSGAGVSLERCVSLSGYHHCFAGQHTSAGVMNVENCIFVGGCAGCWTQAHAGGGHTFSHITAVCQHAYTFYDNGDGCELTNCVSLWSNTNFNSEQGAVVNHCASSDGSADDWGGAGNIVDQTREDLDFWEDNDNGVFSINPRILTTSSLYHTGTPVSGIDYDIDGNARDGTNPSRGAHEGTATPYGVTHPLASEISPGVTCQAWDGQLVGAQDLPAISSVDPLDTLEGATGTMDVPELSSVDPLDTLRGAAGTMDVPAQDAVDPLDTLRGTAGTMDVPELESILITDTLRGEKGKWHKAASTRYQLGYSFGVDGSSETGACRLPAESVVVKSTIYGPSDSLTGTYECIAESATGDMLEDGSDMVTAAMLLHASREITYYRGSSSVTLRAVIGQVTWEVDNGDGGTVERWESRDFIVQANLLILDAAAITPARGDVIREARSGVTYIYEVAAPAGEDHYQWGDHGKNTFRIHTKRKGSE